MFLAFAVHVRLRPARGEGGKYALDAVQAGPMRYLDQYYSEGIALYWYHGDMTSNDPKPNQMFTFLSLGSSEDWRHANQGRWG
jgi:hypothetical protein